MSDWLPEVKGILKKRPKRRWWAVAARPLTGGGFPLDIVTTPGLAAVAAYGLRKLRSSFDGPVINVRRASDNATMDIGLRGAGDLDVQTLSTFLGGSQGFVAIWYDQSINKSNATAIGGLTANQPQIVLGVTPNGRPAVYATATNQGLVAATAANQAIVSFAMVTNRTGNQTAYGLPLSFDGNCPGVSYNNSANGGFVIGNVNLTITGPAAATDLAFHSVIGVMNGAGTQVVVDAGTSASSNITGATGSTQIDLVGRTGNGFIGYMTEGIIWNGALGATDITALMANQDAYWAPSPSFLLDFIGAGAGGAYSLRRLANAYAGPCVNIRRSSDNATQNIGFTPAGDFDVASFNAFVGGGNGFAAAWYDQSGNANHASSAAANQPQLVLAAINGQPALLFTQTLSQYLGIPNNSSVNMPFLNGGYLAAVVNLAQAPTGARYPWITQGLGYEGLGINSGRSLTFGQGASTTNGAWVTSTALSLGSHQIDVQYSAAALSNVPVMAWDNAAQTNSFIQQPVGTINSENGSLIGGNGGPAFPGYIAEMLIYKSQPAPGQIRANQKAYWSTP